MLGRISRIHGVCKDMPAGTDTGKSKTKAIHKQTQNKNEDHQYMDQVGKYAHPFAYETRRRRPNARRQTHAEPRFTTVKPVKEHDTSSWTILRRQAALVFNAA